MSVRRLWDAEVPGEEVERHPTDEGDDVELAVRCGDQGCRQRLGLVAEHVEVVGRDDLPHLRDLGVVGRRVAHAEDERLVPGDDLQVVVVDDTEIGIGAEDLADVVVQRDDVEFAEMRDRPDTAEQREAERYAGHEMPDEPRLDRARPGPQHVVRRQIAHSAAR